LLSSAIIMSVMLLHGEAARAQPVFPTQLIRLPADFLATADFDEDGHPDLAVGSWYGLALLYGSADGTFERKQQLFYTFGGSQAITATADDLDGDGHADLIVGFDSGTVQIFRGRGSQGFEAPIGFAVGQFFTPTSILVGDVDLDGHRDLVFPGGSGVITRLGLGGMVFGPEIQSLGLGGTAFGPEIQVSGPGRAHPAVLADFDHDGRLDLIGAYGTFRGLGNGTFAFNGSHWSGGGESVAVGDFDGDGELDAAFATGSFNTVLVESPIGSPSRVFVRSYPVGGYPSAVVVGDFNGDHRLDLAVASYLSNTVTVLLNHDGTGFTTGLPHPTDEEPVATIAADLNNDGRSDLVVANTRGQSVTLFLGNETGVFDDTRLLPSGSMTRSTADPDEGEKLAAVIDLDADGHPDLVSADKLGHDLFYLRGRGDGTFDDARIVAPALTPQGLLTGRFDDDDLDDILVLDSQMLRVWPGRGDGTVGPAVVTPLPLTAGAAAAADFNGDGRLDVAIGPASPTPPSAPVPLRVLLGRGDGSFDAGVELTWFTGGPLIPKTGDFNGDGRPDLAVLDRGLDTVRIFFGRGDGTFLAGPVLDPGVHPRFTVGSYAIDVGDLNHDGRDDVAVTTADARLSLFSGHGDGSFDSMVQVPTEDLITSMTHADVNGDGFTDLLINGPIIDLVVRFGTPSGGFRPELQFLFGFTISIYDGTVLAGTKRLSGTPLAVDFNGDGRLDVAGPISFFGVGVALNQGGALDLDGDGIPNGIDDCTDQDGDGLGDASFPSNTCPADPCPYNPLPDLDGDFRCGDQDNCPSAFNPGQEDHDADGAGDACDDCPDLSNPDQADQDGDLRGDACDVCPTVADPAQADANQDGSGDACQPTLAITGILEDGGENLEVRALATDPQGEPLSGRIEVIEDSPFHIELLDALADNDCSRGFLPDGEPGKGIGFTFGAIGEPFLFDLASVLGCGDAVPDYLIAPGSCDAPTGAFDLFLALRGLPSPAPVCFRPFASSAGGLDFTVDSYDQASLRGSWIAPVTLVDVRFASGLPRELDLGALGPDRSCRLQVTATDGNTVPVEAAAPFFHHEETRLVFNHAPDAVALAPASAECGTSVTLDGVSSSDLDSSPGTADDIVAYEWFDEAGRPLGAGASLTLALPPGEQHLRLRVTDRFGEIGTATVPVTVTDTSPPNLSIAASPTVLWPPNHRLVPVHVTWQIVDLCDPDPTVTLVDASSDEPDDAPGNGDGQTTGDVADAAPGTGDADLQLRAERLATGGGRTYDLLYRAIDASGNATSIRLAVTVPRDQGQGPDPLSLRLEPVGPDGRVRITWPVVSGAFSYDVIAGDLAGILPVAGTLRLGAVQVLARSLTSTTLTEQIGVAPPPPGAAIFYLVQSRGADGPSGFGEASAPLPRSPSSCDAGCP
jgi:hypothetical protein